MEVVRGRYSSRGIACLCVLQWTDKYTGLGEIGESAYLPRAVETMIDTRFKKMLLGEDPFNIEKIWRKLYIQSAHYGRRGVIATILSGIDIALYDVMGKILQRPVYDLIGGSIEQNLRHMPVGEWRNL